MGSNNAADSGLPRPGRVGAAPPTADFWLDGLPLAVLGIDCTGKVIAANNAAEELFADLKVNPAGKPLAEVVGTSSPLLSLTERVRCDACIVEAAVQLPGAGPYAAVTAAPVGELGHVALTIRRAAPSRGEEPSRARAIRTFSHEVRNPLAGIRAAAQLISRDAAPEHASLLALICEEVDRLRRLTERFDPLARDEPVNLRSLNIHEPLAHVRNVIGSLAPTLSIVERYDPSLPAVRGDHDQLVQAFLNIGKNAVEALAQQEDGELKIVTTYRPGVRVKAADKAAAQPLLEVSFVDNGPGVSGDVGGRIFDAFVTTKEAGMGLGLSIASAIVARHGGAIEVQSAPGLTEFKISLPIDSGHAA
jgi:two-component system nitrogen regulation sensor histidine kinase GlnL